MREFFRKKEKIRKKFSIFSKRILKNFLKIIFFFLNSRRFPESKFFWKTGIFFFARHQIQVDVKSRKLKESLLTTQKILYRFLYERRRNNLSFFPDIATFRAPEIILFREKSRKLWEMVSSLFPPGRFADNSKNAQKNG